MRYFLFVHFTSLPDIFARSSARQLLENLRKIHRIAVAAAQCDLGYVVGTVVDELYGILYAQAV